MSAHKESGSKIDIFLFEPTCNITEQKILKTFLNLEVEIVEICAPLCGAGNPPIKVEKPISDTPHPQKDLTI